MLETTVKIIKHKVGLLNLAEELGNVSRARKTMGLYPQGINRETPSIAIKQQWSREGLKAYSTNPGVIQT